MMSASILGSKMEGFEHIQENGIIKLIIPSYEWKMDGNGWKVVGIKWKMVGNGWKVVGMEFFQPNLGLE